ncbi:MAG: alpha/beta hydrolase [Mucilaginibacter sp.]|jgi:pimeloyl-ACP methyl ester carboxylesterase|uniref:alpha/beta hydrolase n=1 Tax=Mucilaginibacter sp. TaxID=1882438 RepID=UPI003566F048
MKTIKSKHIVFITGAFVTADAWQEWQVFFSERGYQTSAPAWPHKDAPACTLRQRHPDPAIASLRLETLIEYFIRTIVNLPEKPILIGHSMGGLIAQILVNRGYAAGAIAIHSLQPKGVFTFKFSFYKAGWGPLGFFTSTKKSFLMTFREWQYAFTNGMSYEEQKEGYYNFLTPESKLLIRDGISDAAKVDFKKAHAPLLFVAGGSDNFIPASLNFSNFKKYSHEQSVTDYTEFPGRNHFVLGQSGWEDVAQYIFTWLNN